MSEDNSAEPVSRETIVWKIPGGFDSSSGSHRVPMFQIFLRVRRAETRKNHKLAPSSLSHPKNKFMPKLRPVPQNRNHSVQCSLCCFSGPGVSRICRILKVSLTGSLSRSTSRPARTPSCSPQSILCSRGCSCRRMSPSCSYTCRCSTRHSCSRSGGGWGRLQCCPTRCSSRGCSSNMNKCRSTF